MTQTYENAPTTINEARARVLIGDMKPTGSYRSDDQEVFQYKTQFGMVTEVRDTFGDTLEWSLLRFAPD